MAVTTRWLYGVETAHVPSIRAVGWGEPLTIYSTCSCGWTGLTVEEQWFSAEETEFALFQEPWRTVAKTYGPEHTLAEDSVFGTQATALVQVLEHLGYAPSADRAHAEALLATAHEALLTALSAKSAEEARRLMDVAANEVVEALTRKIAWETEPRPVATPRHPEAVRLLNEARTKA